MRTPYESAMDKLSQDLNYATNSVKIRALTLRLVRECLEYPVLFNINTLDYAPILEIAEQLDTLISNDILQKSEAEL